MRMRMRLRNPPLIARKYKKPAFNFEAGCWNHNRSQ